MHFLERLLVVSVVILKLNCYSELIALTYLSMFVIV